MTQINVDKCAYYTKYMHAKIVTVQNFISYSALFYREVSDASHGGRSVPDQFHGVQVLVYHLSYV